MLEVSETFLGSSLLLPWHLDLSFLSARVIGIDVLPGVIGIEKRCWDSGLPNGLLVVDGRWRWMVVCLEDGRIEMRTTLRRWHR